MPSSQWGHDQFSPAALNAAEVEVWKPMLTAGWRIEGPTGPSSYANTWVPEGDYPAFQALMANPQPKSIFYDQVAGLEERGGIERGYPARCRIIGNDGGDYFSDAGAARLFDVLGVTRDDVFNGQNGWTLGVGDGGTHFRDFPYYNRIM